jgi:integrase
VDTNSTRLTDAIVKRLSLPATGNRIHYDADVKGFGARVTAGGARAFILTYRTHAGRQRRYTIGSFPDWQTTAAREEARRLKRAIDGGGDPLAELAAARGAPTVADLIARFELEHLPRKRGQTAAHYRRLIASYIAPALRHLKVADVRFEDADRLHHRITKDGKPYAANRCMAVGSKMFALAIRWGWRPDNPFRGIERNVEHKRKRYLTADELKRLNRALAEYPDRQAVDIFRLLMLTGARVGETLAARWDAIDLTAGQWTKPGSTTKQKTDHTAPLSEPARQLLAALRRETNSQWVFPAKSGDGHRTEVKHAWPIIRAAAGLAGLRIHDLRHSFASQLASSGASLPLIGSLLGHSNPVTTARYAHLFDDPQREAVERVGKIIAGSRR